MLNHEEHIALARRITEDLPRHYPKSGWSAYIDGQLLTLGYGGRQIVFTRKIDLIKSIKDWVYMNLKWREDIRNPADLEAITKILLSDEGGPIEIRQVWSQETQSQTPKL